MKAMLKVGERIIIGDKFVVTLTNIKGSNRAVISVNGDKDTPINREVNVPVHMRPNSRGEFPDHAAIHKETSRPNVETSKYDYERDESFEDDGFPIPDEDR